MCLLQKDLACVYILSWLAYIFPLAVSHFQTLIHFELNLGWEVWTQLHFSTGGHTFLAYCLRLSVIPNAYFWHFDKKKIGDYKLARFISRSSIFLGHTSASVCLPSCSAQTDCGMWFKTKHWDASSITLLLMMALVIWGLLFFCINFRVVHSSSVKNEIAFWWSFHWIHRSLWII